MNENMWFGLAWGQKRHIAALQRLVSIMERRIDNLVDHVKILQRIRDDLKQRVTFLRAARAGLSACILAFRKAHPDSPLLKQVGVFKTGEMKGEPKRALYLIYAKAFDEEAIKQGIKDPKSLRSD
jgi:hypothetical protein